jgi:coenzyme F420-reducing hydrogenase alpha subunit
MESDRAKKEVWKAQKQILEYYNIQSSFLPKEHHMVHVVRNLVRAFDSCTSCQAIITNTDPSRRMVEPSPNGKLTDMKSPW